MRYRILPYKQGSKSAKALAEELGGKVLKLVGSTFVQKTDDVVINWGKSDGPSFTYLNPPLLTSVVGNKRQFFQLMKEKCPDVIPQFWTSKEAIPEDAYPIVCRTILNGHSGAGIVIADTAADLVDAPLYVQYVKKKDEYRVHLGQNNGEIEVISVQRKARRLDFPEGEVNWQVRNLSNGFVYVRQDVVPPDSVTGSAKTCFSATGLDFGAVDVIWNDQLQKAYVLEINTAPGLEGQTIKDYAEFFRGMAE